MKTRTLILALSLILVASTNESCQTRQNPLSADDEYGYCSPSALQTQLQSVPIETLNEAERSSLIRMREEEKLARDVYTTMYARWGSMVFTNISASEQTHMDAVLLLLQRYTIADPTGNRGVGVFNDSTLQALYTQLVAKGNESLIAAYSVGATIEDLDIADLKYSGKNIDNQDIKLVYDNLTRGSRNHMRAYYRNLQSLNANYTPVYISQSEFLSIIQSDMERGFCGR